MKMLMRLPQTNCGISWSHDWSRSYADPRSYANHSGNWRFNFIVSVITSYSPEINARSWSLSRS
jgi:hypothetical protein